VYKAGGWAESDNCHTIDFITENQEKSKGKPVDLTNDISYYKTNDIS
jgi:hypothetical protein